MKYLLLLSFLLPACYVDPAVPTVIEYDNRPHPGYVLVGGKFVQKDYYESHPHDSRYYHEAPRPVIHNRVEVHEHVESHEHEHHEMQHESRDHR